MVLSNYRSRFTKQITYGTDFVKSQVRRHLAYSNTLGPVKSAHITRNTPICTRWKNATSADVNSLVTSAVISTIE